MDKFYDANLLKFKEFHNWYKNCDHGIKTPEVEIMRYLMIRKINKKIDKTIKKIRNKFPKYHTSRLSKNIRLNIVKIIKQKTQSVKYIKITKDISGGYTYFEFNLTNPVSVFSSEIAISENNLNTSMYSLVHIPMKILSEIYYYVNEDNVMKN